MKATLTALMLLFLSSCIAVDGFGNYWENAVVDTTLSGNWERTWPPFEENNEDPFQKLHFIEKENSFELVTHGTMLNNTHKKPQVSKSVYFPTKTLNVGPYHFIITYDQQNNRGQMFRYELEGEALSVYSLVYKTACEFYKNKFPDTKAIHHSGDFGQWGPECAFGLLDDKLFNAFASTPDNSTYWLLFAKFRKSP